MLVPGRTAARQECVEARHVEEDTVKYDPTRHVHIGIAGTGFAGLGAGILLKQAGIDDFMILERAADVGGTWRDNSYPGCACDVESHLYSFSFAPNPDWSRLFAPQPEIFAYLRKCAKDHGILPHIRFGHEIQEVRWDDDAQLWRIQTSQGPYTADIVIGGMGPLCEPSIPDIKGLDTFQGKTFHSARWDHDYDLTGKRVAVIGTGASAIQFVPEIQPKVAHLTLFQRTPAWVLPRMDRQVTETEKTLFRKYPALQLAMRWAIYARRELFVIGFRNPQLMGWVERLALNYLERTVADPELRKKLTPNFRIGCKRILLSRDYLPSLTRPNVSVVTEGIREVRPHSIVTADGVEHEVDAIIFGTGFKVTDMPFADVVYGRDGRSLNETWGGSPQAHLGTAVAGYPNLFLLLGPNTGLGHTSVVLMIEAQLKVVMGAIQELRKRKLDIVEVRPEAQRKFVEEVDRDMRDTVWTAGGCHSWYLDKTGRNSTLWPGFTFTFMQKARFRPAEFVMQRRRQQRVDEAAPSKKEAPVVPFPFSVMRRATKEKKVRHA
jgi:cation diffusion facilitator CzcD-associated flavoprotein CzcO